MLGRLTNAAVQTSQQSIASRLSAGIALLNKRPRGVYDKTNYIEDWVPREKKFHHNRKPRLAQWDDPNVVWPPVSVKPTKSHGKKLLDELQQEEASYLKLSKGFKIPDFRSGDVIRFHYLHSLSEGNGNTITGLCVGKDKPTKLMGSFTVLFNFAGVPVRMKIKLNSPFLTDFQIMSKGSGDLKYKLAYIWKLDKRTIPVAPIIKRTMAKRTDDEGKGKRSKQAKIADKLANQKSDPRADTIEDPLLI